ncbi:ABC transporter permease [Methanobacterium sp. YSL]|nr:ABC transporter permease [Methanobacterium sp. YSL]
MEVSTMYNMTSLVRRNIKVFLRDKAAVFFSFLSVIILLGLYFLFLGRQYTSGTSFDSISTNLKTFLGVGVIMGGVLVINTVSLSLGVMGTIVSDIETRRLEGFMVTPIERYKVILAYFISSTIVTVTLSVMMWLLTVLYVGFGTGYWYSIQTILLASLLILFYTFISSALMLFLVTLIKSQNAFGALAGVLGTVIGFMSGIYMPLFVLGKGMANIASLVPFTHMTILLKQVILKEAYAELPAPFAEGLAESYGTQNIGVFGTAVPMFWLMAGSFMIAMILLLLAYRNMNQKMVK